MPGRLPPLPPAPGSAYPTILPSDEPAEAGRSRGHRSDRADETPTDERPDRSKLLPLLLALAVILGGGYLLVSQLTGGDDTDNTPVPRASRPVASASAAPSAPARTYTAAQIAQALQDPHFKHGYDAGKAKAASGAVSDPEVTCREMGLAERTKGYPWGAHDRQGCLVGLTG